MGEGAGPDVDTGRPLLDKLLTYTDEARERAEAFAAREVAALAASP